MAYRPPLVTFRRNDFLDACACTVRGFFVLVDVQRYNIETRDLRTAKDNSVKKKNTVIFPSTKTRT